MKKIFCALIVVGIFFGAVSGFAEMRAGAYSISPYIGIYKFEGNLDLDSGPTYGVRLGYDFTKRFGLEADLGYVDTKYTEFAPDRYTDVYNYRLEALYHFFPDKKLVPFAAVGFGGQSMNYKNTSKSDSTHFAGDYGVGLKYFLTENVALRTDLRHILGFASIENNLAWTFGLTFLFGGEKPMAEKAIVREAAAPAVMAPADSDGDGVADSSDKCPGTPAGVKVDLNGCPLDMDGDGVYDYLDKCPDTPKGVKVDKDGCPLDTDRDGVADYRDNCPSTPAGVKVDKDGCPLDMDGDGIYDYLDKCPDTPKGVKVDANGCPLDSDKDGVYDYLDKCPGTPGGIKVDKDGCPVKASITLKIQFDTGKSVIKKEYRDEIKQVADFMKQYPHTDAVIEGHTDNVGREAANVKLSQARANSVRDYLIKEFGIDKDRLKAVGYGPKKPIASNATAEGKQQNRRVEAIITTVVRK
ncbi:MAG TPA: outer membrane beta-barrel domain-containing protein [Syntrophales bacterium]|nr:outer membrane beta-barrel domain-containing protein [Syntrophales bacterium]